MKAIITTLFLAMTQALLFAQNNVSGEATYLVSTLANTKQDKLLESIEPFADKIASDFEFILLFNGDRSSFYLNNTAALKKYSEKSLRMSAIKYEYADTVWQDLEKSYSVTSFPWSSEKLLLIRYKDDPNWKITSEKKEIGKYTCYKATKVIIRVRGKKTFSTPVMAWFCPDIPAPYGPLDFGNLPGLIFELQTDKLHYGLQQIRIAKNIEVPDKPNIKKQYTEDQLIEQLNTLVKQQ